MASQPEVTKGMLDLFRAERNLNGVRATITKMKRIGYSLKQVTALLRSEGYDPKVWEGFGVTVITINSEARRKAWQAYQTAIWIRKNANFDGNTEALKEALKEIEKTRQRWARPTIKTIFIWSAWWRRGN